MKSIILAIAAVALSSQVDAAIITKTFDVILPAPQGQFLTGHTFHIAVSYDEDGQTMTEYNDGLNKIGELGGGDDTVYKTYNLPLGNYTLMDDALITIDGIVYPTGTNPSIGQTENSSRYFEVGDPNTSGAYYVTYYVDSITLQLISYGPTYSTQMPTGRSTFFLATFQNTLDGNPGHTYVHLAEERPDAWLTANPAPEPAILALLGVGLAGLGLTRRRRGQQAGSV